MNTAEEAPVGRIETLRFARLLAQFWERGFTGSFRARSTVRPGATVTREILYERGRIAWAASDDPEESIRAHLINRGLLRPDQWRLAEEKAGAAQVRQTLLELGFLTARELQEADRERVTGIVLSLFSWRDGRCESTAGGLPHGTPNLKIDPRDMVLEGLMSSGDRGLVLDEIGTLDAVLVVRPDDLVRASLSLPVELVGLMGKADGTRTIADICALSSLPDFLISAAFAGLKVLGLARPIEGAPAAAPPAPPTAGPEKPAVRKRPGRGSSAAAAAAGESPRLPLYPSEEFETVPMAATPPGGVHSVGTGAAMNAVEDVDDSGTRPLKSVPERRLEPEPETGPFAEDAVIQTAPRPAPAATVPAVAAIPEPPDERPISFGGEEEEFDREVEVELKPGIPVAPGPGSPVPHPPTPLAFEPSGPSDIRDVEIENVIQFLDAPPAEEAAQRPGEAAPSVLASGASEEDDDEFLGEGEGASDERSDEDEGPEEPPAWVYEPSAEPAAAAGRVRWATWGGIAAAIFGLGAALILLFGTGDSESHTPEDAGTTAAAPPADVLAPAAFTSDQGSPAVAPASFAETAPDPAASSLRTDDVPSRPARGTTPAPARPSVANPSKPRENRSLASNASGSIFASAPYREGRRLLGSGDFAAAARRFETAVGGRTGLYTVQLALACEPETVTRALASTSGSSQFFILPVEHQGRGCYRMLWGAYASRSAAADARSSVPSRFLKDPHPPTISRL